MKKYGIYISDGSTTALQNDLLAENLREKARLITYERVLRGEKSVLLKRYLEKTMIWGKELGLI